MKYGKGTLTTIYDRVNFYRDVYSDPHVTFKREGDKITLISGDGTIINDKLIAKSEDVFDHKFDTYTPLKKQLNENQQIAINNAKKSFEKGADIYDCAIDMMLYDGLTDKEWAKVTVAFLLWVLEQEEE